MKLTPWFSGDQKPVRLAVKLGLWLTPRCAIKEIAVDFGGDQECLERFTDDPYAATRRAIVRAAAEIGKEMK